MIQLFSRNGSRLRSTFAIFYNLEVRLDLLPLEHALLSCLLLIQPFKSLMVDCCFILRLVVVVLVVVAAVAISVAVVVDSIYDFARSTHVEQTSSTESQVSAEGFSWSPRISAPARERLLPCCHVKRS